MTPAFLARARTAFVVIAVLALSAISVSLWGGKQEKSANYDIKIESSELTAAQVAYKNRIPLPVVLKVMGIDSSLQLVATLASVSLTPEQAKAKITRALIQYDEHRSKNWTKIGLKFSLWLLVLPVPLVLMARKRLTPARRKWLYGFSVLAFGVALGSDPSPMGTVNDAVFLLTAHQTVFGRALSRWGSSC